RRPLQFQFLLHHRRQQRARHELASLRPPRPLPCSAVRVSGAVLPAATVARDLPRDRRRRAAQAPRDATQRLVRSETAADLLPLLDAQMLLTAPAHRWPDTARRAHVLTDRRGRSPKVTSDPAKRPSLPAQFPYCDLLLSCQRTPHHNAPSPSPSRRSSSEVLRRPCDLAALIERPHSRLTRSLAGPRAAVIQEVGTYRSSPSPSSPYFGDCGAPLWREGHVAVDLYVRR